MTKHKPWRTGIGNEARCGVYNSNGKWIADCTDAESAQVIVVAVNHYEEMRRLLDKAVDKLNRQDIYEELREEIYQFSDAIDKEADHD